MPEPDDVIGLADDLRAVVWEFVRQQRAASDGVVELSLAQQGVLNRLDSAGSMTSAELARAERVRPQSMSVTVAALRSAGLVEARPSEADGRVRELALTPRGRESIMRVREVRADWVADRLASRLDADQRAQLAEALEALRVVLRNP